MVIIKITNLNLNKGPRAALSEIFFPARGRAASRIPWGHMYLQKYGGTTSY